MKSSKILISFFIIHFLLFGLFISNLAAGIIVKATPSNLNPVNGETITISIIMKVTEPLFKLGAFWGTLNWDPQAIQYITTNACTARTSIKIEVNSTDVTTGYLSFAGISPYGITDETIVLTSKFVVLNSSISYNNLNLKLWELIDAQTFIDLMPYIRELYQKIIEAEAMQNRVSSWGSSCEDGWRITHNSQFIYEWIDFPKSQHYKLTIRAKGEMAGKEYPMMKIRMRNVIEDSCSLTSTEWKDYQFSSFIPAGVHRMDIIFLNDYWAPPNDQNLLVDKVIIEDIYDILPGEVVYSLKGENMPIHTTGYAWGNGWVLTAEGYVAQDMVLKNQAYVFEIIARGDFVGDDWPNMNVYFDDVFIGNVIVNSSNFLPYRFETNTISAGNHRLKIAFTNDYWSPPDDRNLYIDKLIVYSKSTGLTKPFAENIHEREGHLTEIPEVFSLSQNYPNPFNPDTYINYQLPEASPIVIKVYNPLGQVIRELVNENKNAGYHSVRWDGNDKFGNQVGSGVYFYEIKAGSSTLTRKMVVLR